MVVVDIVEVTKTKKKIVEEIDSVFSLGIVGRSDYVDIFDKIDKNSIFLCAYEDNEPIGYAAMYANDFTNKNAFISMLGVCKSKQGRNVGSLLVENCVKEAKKRGMKMIRLEVLKHNTGAIVFYRKCGFEIEKECSKHSIYMQLIL